MFGMFVGYSGPTRLILTSGAEETVGAPSFAFFAKGGRPRTKVLGHLSEAERSRRIYSVHTDRKRRSVLSCILFQSKPNVFITADFISEYKKFIVFIERFHELQPLILL